MIKTPKISVLITSIDVNIDHFESCIGSLLNQTFTNFEIIIILEPLNKDNLRNLEYIKNKYRDDRILYFVLDDKSLDRSYALNYGVRKAKAKYIAIIDVDDICLRYRLEQQFNFMEKTNECIVCGSHMKTFGDSKKIISTPIYDSLNRFANILFCKVPILHPTAFIKKDAFDMVSYSNEYKAEDYKFWIDLAIKTDMEFYNIPKVLVKYRVHKNQSSTINRKAISKEIIDSCMYYLKSLNLNMSENDMCLHKNLISRKVRLNFNNKRKIEKYLKNLKTKIEYKYGLKLNRSFYHYTWYYVCFHFAKNFYLPKLIYFTSSYFSLVFFYHKIVNFIKSKI